MGCTIYSGVVSDDRTVIYRLKETLRIERARKGVQGGKELRDDRVDQAGRWGKECSVISSIVKRGKGRTKSVGCFGSVPFDHGNFII